MKKSLFFFLMVLNSSAFGQTVFERSINLAEELRKEFSLSKIQTDNIYKLNLKAAIALDSLILESSKEKEGRIPLETMDQEEEKELERIEKQWRKGVKKIIGPGKISELKKEERRENKKEISSDITGLEYDAHEMYKITSKELGFLNLNPY